MVVVAGLAIPVVEFAALVLRIGFIYTFVLFVVRHGRTVDLDTLEPVPILLVTASRFGASLVLEDEAIRAFALVVQRVVDFATLAHRNLVTFVDIGECSYWADACINGGIPNSAIGTSNSRREAGSSIPNFVVRTFARLFLIIPFSAVGAGVRNTVVVVPDGSDGTFASPHVLVPHHSSVALLHHLTLFVVPHRPSRTHTFQRRLIPNLPVIACLAFLCIPFRPARTNALESFQVPSLTSCAFRLDVALSPIPVLSFGTHTVLEDCIPNSVATALIGFLAGDSGPFVAGWALTSFLLIVPFLSVDAFQTN